MAFNKSNNKFNRDVDEPKIMRAPLPKGREVLGVIDQRHGGNKMKVNCVDGKERVGRVPGRLKRHLWLRPNDIVIIEPWELDDTKGDVLLKYKPNQVKWLEQNGHLETEKDEF
jgi:translation initiation factor 1A